MTPEERAKTIRLYTTWCAGRDERSWDDVRADIAAQIHEAVNAEAAKHADCCVDREELAAAPDLRAALEEIAKGEGAFSRDPLQHCANAVESMRAIARAALAKARPIGAPASEPAAGEAA